MIKRLIDAWHVLRYGIYHERTVARQKGCTLSSRHPDCWEHGCEGYEPCEVLEQIKAKEG
mgnify:CR=1 FL=1